ncbi:unnamed protein product [Phytophthora fragariaefolia]|uniref:Unnamed protein product n=1 Tax=Phytophthora fragariaefolia TaxID=1490495 RepID=A0A9W6WY69_9STRA|nr:unnamed protein product [Phytophthora fragariaefolia]
MGFSFAITVSCQLQVRATCEENAEAQLDQPLLKSKELQDSHQLIKSDPDPPFYSTSLESVSVGAPVASYSPSGYISMVLMEDLDPEDGTAVRGTISMVVIEDVAISNEADAKRSMEGAIAIRRTYSDKECAATLCIKRWWKTQLTLLGRQSLPIQQLEKALEVVHRSQTLDEVMPAIAIIRNTTTTTPGCYAKCFKTPILISMYNLVIRMSSQSASLPSLYAVLMLYTSLIHYRRSNVHQLKALRRSKQVAALRQMDLLWMEMLVDVMVMLSVELQHTRGSSWLAVKELDYFEQREKFNLLGMIMSPSFLTIIVPIGLLYLLPKLSEGMGEENSVEEKRREWGAGLTL